MTDPERLIAVGRWCPCSESSLCRRPCGPCAAVRPLREIGRRRGGRASITAAVDHICGRDAMARGQERFRALPGAADPGQGAR